MVTGDAFFVLGNLLVRSCHLQTGTMPITAQGVILQIFPFISATEMVYLFQQNLKKKKKKSFILIFKRLYFE